MRTILIAATILCFLINCKTGKSGAAKRSKDINRLKGSWELIYVAETTTGFNELYPGRKPMMVIDPANKHINGNTGCNSFSGPVTLDGNKVSFDQPLILTKMFCTGEGENTFLGALKKINTWAVNDETTLNFLMNDLAVLRFSKVQ